MSETDEIEEELHQERLEREAALGRQVRQGRLPIEPIQKDDRPVSIDVKTLVVSPMPQIRMALGSPESFVAMVKIGRA